MHPSQGPAGRLRRMRVRARPQGFTLLELMITLAVVAILAALATPSFTGVVNSNRLTSQANELVAGIQTARSEALRRNRRITLCRSTDGATCAAAAGEWNAWLVAVPGTNPLEIIQRATLKAPLELTAGVANVDFRPDGLARDAGTGGLLATTFTLCLPTTRPAENVRQVTLAGGSRVNITSATHSTPGSCP